MQSPADIGSLVARNAFDSFIGSNNDVVVANHDVIIAAEFLKPRPCDFRARSPGIEAY